MVPIFDLVVVGCGGIGSGILYHAAQQRSWKVLGIDAHQPPHALGSSHGQSRIIRQAYFEHADYVPLLLDAYEDWYQLERHSGRELLRHLGLIQIGSADGVVLPGVMQSAKEHSLPVEHLTKADSHRRFPMFRLEAGEEAVYEPKAGVLWVEECVRAHLEQAQHHGATCWTNCSLQSYRLEADGVVLETTRGPVQAKQLVMACGAWTPHWLQPEWTQRHPFTILRKQLHWYRPLDGGMTPEQGCPMFLMEMAEGCFYGFPDLRASGMKVGEHSGGQVVEDPSQVDRQLNDTDLQRVNQFLQQRVVSPLEYRDYSVCLYTMSPDQHFVIDRDLEDERIVWASGFSGHGFKFASILGRLLVDWLVNGNRDPRLEFLSQTRFVDSLG